MMKKELLVGLMMLLLWAILAVPCVCAGDSAKVLIKAQDLAETLGAPNLRVIDCRRDVESYNKGHIPGAVFLNVKKELRTTGAWGVVGVRRGLEEQEELFGRKLGISNDTMVVLYDAEGWDATRLFWELKYAGHDKVALLYGGWPQWQEGGFEISTEAATVAPAIFVAQPRSEILATGSYVLANLGDPNVVMLDCRNAKHFKGVEKFKNAAVGGHIPGAANVFTLNHWENKTYLKSPDELMETFEDAGVSKEKTVVAYCNTGYYAANTFFILKALGYPDVRLYDYSWTEWSAKDYLPKVLAK